MLANHFSLLHTDDIEPCVSAVVSGGVVLEDESSAEDLAGDEFDEFDQEYPAVASEGSDSDDQAIEPAPSGRRTRMKMKRLMQLVAKVCGSGVSVLLFGLEWPFHRRET